MARDNRSSLRPARGLAAAALLICAHSVAACGSSTPAAPTHAPLAAAPAPALPAGLTACNVLGEVVAGKPCRVFDTVKGAFSDTPDGTPDDALARRAFLYDRWLDLYNAPEKQVVVRNLTVAMAPGDPESKFGDDAYLGFYDDHGDSAGFGEEGQLAAAFRYAVTGTDADYQRLEDWARGAVRQWDATGIDGYLARWHFAGVPAGTPIKNGYSMQVRTSADVDSFDIPAAALPRMPAYYSTGLDIAGAHVPVQPSWEGHTSIDAYAGPMGAWPFLWDLLKDADLKARMARHYGCFIKRLKPFHIYNLSKNVSLQASIGMYLNNGVLNLDPDDPDLTRLDEIWGFYLPQYNHASAATYPAACPDSVTYTPLPTEDLDATSSNFKGPLVDFILRQVDGNNLSDSIDFVYYASVRAGDALMLETYALGAYHLTKDPQFLAWRDQLINGKANAQAISRTVGAFKLPKACANYYRLGNIYTPLLGTVLLDANADEKAFAQMIFTRKFAAKEMAGERNSHFELMYAAAVGTQTPNLADAVAELRSFGGAPGYLDDPRRNYGVDLNAAPPPGIVVAKSTPADLAVCSTPITVLGFTVPPDMPDPNELFCSPAPPVMARPPDNYQWEKNPYSAVRIPGDAGRQQYAGVDFVEPYWLARYFKLIPDTHLVLAR